MIYIYSVHYNIPKFIELQYNSFKKFIDFDEYKFIIIDNSIEDEISKSINEISKKYNIDTIKTNNHIKDKSGFSHLVGIDIFIKNLKKHNSEDIVILLDHDIFLTSNLSKIKNDIISNSILTIKQNREHVNYIWPGLVIFNLKKCINIHELSLGGCEFIDNKWVPIDGVFTDVGGQSYYYLNKYSDIIKLYDLTDMCVSSNTQSGIIDPDNNYIFYHFLDGSNWSNYSTNIWNEKLSKIENYLI